MRTLLTVAALGAALGLHAQTFQQGTYLETGLSPCGSYGTDAPVPPGYHPNAFTGGLGIVADLDRDGWDVGVPNLYCGDYFLPGAAVEGFQIEASGVVYTNGNGSTVCTNTDFGTGGYTTIVSGGAEVKRWTGSAGGLDVRQEALIIENRLVVLHRVTIANHTGADLDSVFYQRHNDPDPGQPWGGSFATRHGVKRPAFGTGAAAVATTFPQSFLPDIECYLGMLSGDPRADASYGGFAFGAPSAAYAGISPFRRNGVEQADAAIQLTFYLGSLADGEETCLSWAYVFDRDEANRAWSATRIACPAMDAFARHGDADALLTELFGTNATEADRALAWTAERGAIRLLDLAAGERVRVYDAAGRLVFAGTATAPERRIDGLPAGLYVVELSAPDGTRRVAKAMAH
jgi:hypothetical protein